MKQETRFSLRTKQPPNVIWVLTDQLRAQCLGYRNDPNVATPNLDNLAREGMRFDGAVAGAPWCCPFRGALLTGRYPHQNGVIRTPSALDPSLPTLAQPFKKAGYHTAWVGKWHLDGSNSREHYVPPERRGGFDYWRGYENNNNQNEVFVYGGGDETPHRLEDYETDGLTDIFIDHLRSHTRRETPDAAYQPFFACLSVQPPHDPFVGPTNPSYAHTRFNPASLKLRGNVPPIGEIQDQARFHLAGYYSMIENIDYNLGRLRLALKAMGIDRETYVVFFSDHGEMAGSHGLNGKVSPYEESIRIPLLIGKVGGPTNINVGGSDAVVNHVDIAPTTLGLCGLPVPEWMVGHDYSGHCTPPFVEGYAGPPESDEEPTSAYLQQIPELAGFASRISRPWRGVVCRDGWKYTAFDGQDWLLHNTREDPLETTNLAFITGYHDKLQEMRATLRGWVAETGDTFNVPMRSVGP